jgi:hypothetical protein
MKMPKHLLALSLYLLTSCSATDHQNPAAPQVVAPLATPVASPMEDPVEVPEAAQKPLDAGLFERFAILGSSASAGFNIILDTGVPTRLADYFEAGLLVEHELVSDGANVMTFLAPERIAGAAVAAALAENPSLVIGVDFLFWFFYGSGGPGNTLEFRRQRLEDGIALLDQFTCPVLVGDLPNMAGAAGGMIPLASMPPADSFADANGRIREWAASKSNVVVVPLAEFNETVGKGEPFQIGDFTWDPVVSGELLQMDQLHPNLAGCAVLALQTMLSLADSRGATLEGIIMVNPEDLADAVDDLVTSR